MLLSSSEARAFTFVGYDINRRGVTDHARAHLMRDRVRNKKEARSEWVTRNQGSTLRWMRPKEVNNHPNSDIPSARSPISDESDEASDRQMSHYSAVIDFQRDCVTVSPFVSKARSRSPRLTTMPRSNLRRNLENVDNASESSSDSRKHGRSPESGVPVDISAFNSPFFDAESPRSSASTWDAGLLALKQRRTSTESTSEFGLSFLEGWSIANTPSPLPPPEGDTDLEEGWQRRILRSLNEAAVKHGLTLTQVDRSLLRYFAVNVFSMLGLDVHAELVIKHDPVWKLFLPFVTSSRWCFETMVLLFSANHCRTAESIPEIGLLDTESHHLASRQNFILARTRARISGLASEKDSSDADVVAFIFLALAEYCAGNRQIGLMHFEAWREYCEMRRIHGIKPCGLACKTVVWWCISVICEDDVVLDGILNQGTRARIREDPGKLFRYFEAFESTQFSEEEHSFRPELAGRRGT